MPRIKLFKYKRVSSPGEFMIKKGQVSTEYLIILAVVLVIALVVVFLVTQSSGGASATLQTQSQTAWQSAQPLAVTAVSASGTTFGVTMKNNDLQKVTVTGVTTDSTDDYAVSTTFNPGEEKSVTLTLSSDCGALGTQLRVQNVSITYTKGSTAGLKETSGSPLIVTCG